MQSTFKDKLLKLSELYNEPVDRFTILYNAINDKLTKNLLIYEEQLNDTYKYLLQRDNYKVLKQINKHDID